MGRGPGWHGTGPVEFGPGDDQGRGQEGAASGARPCDAPDADRRPYEGRAPYEDREPYEGRAPYTPHTPHRPDDAEESGYGPAEQLASPGGNRAAEWWSGLTRGRRALLSGAVACTVLGGGLGYLAAHRPAAPVPAPPPWPTQVTTVSFEGIDTPAGGPGQGAPSSFSVRIRFEVAASARVPVTVTAVEQGYASLATRTVPDTPITVRPGEYRRLTMVVRVRDCSRTPISAGMPLVNVTLSNTRAIRTRSEIFGERYAHALSAALRALCPTGVKSAMPLSAR